MAKNKNIKNAVILAVLLSSVTAGSVWAAEKFPLDTEVADDNNIAVKSAVYISSEDMFSLAGMESSLDKIQAANIKNLSAGISDKAGTDIGIDNTETIIIINENGTVLGTAKNTDGDAVGIENSGTIIAKTVTGIADTINGNATGISNSGTINAKDIIGQAGSENGDATGINSGPITADGNIVGMAEAGEWAVGVQGPSITLQP